MNIQIYHDPFCTSPREWDHLGTLVCAHRRYDLSDVPFPQAGKYGSLYEDFKAYLATESLSIEDVIYTRVYLYDHSGIALQSKPFSCRWDSGLVGFNYVSKARIRTEYSIKRISSKLNQTVVNVLNSELEAYNHYVQNNCYEFRITAEDGTFIDSCGGFLGDFDEVKLAMYEHIDSTLWSKLEAISYNDVIY